MTLPSSPASDVPHPSGAGAPTLVLVVNMPLEPVPKGRARSSNGRHYTPERTREAEASAGILMRSAMKGQQPYTERMAVTLHFDCPTRRRIDLDNLSKLILDAGNQIVWSDDALIDELHVTRRLGVRPPRVRLEVSLLEEAA